VTVDSDDGICGSGLVLAPEGLGDACDAASVQVFSDAPPLYPVGTTTVTLTAVDGAGNQSTCATTVTVSEAGPRAILCPADVTREAPADACEVVETMTAQVVDQCQADITLAVEARAFSVGVHDVDFRVDDAQGELSCTAQVTVVDVTAPTVACNAPAAITALPAAVRALGGDACRVALSARDVACVDAQGAPVAGCELAVEGDTVVVTAAPSGAVVTWSVDATDPSGNAAEVDCQAPVALPEVPVPTPAVCPAGWDVNEDGACDLIVAEGGGGCASGPGGGSGAPLGLALASLLGWLLWRRRRFAAAAPVRGAGAGPWRRVK
jgi:uncharacterized protein (TIGR03382 family)